MSEKKRTKLLIGSAGAVFFATAAQALTFNFTAPAGFDPQALAGFQAAAARWSASFSDNITINITLASANLGSSEIADTEPTTYTTNGSPFGSGGTLPTYGSAVTALKTKIVSSDDSSSFSGLQNTSFNTPSQRNSASFKMLLNYTADNPNGSGSATTYLVSSNTTLNSHINMPNANAKAIGLLSANSTAVDATITYNTSMSFDFNPVDGIDVGKLDFVGVFTHEIGHALGFDSGVDILDQNSPEKNGQYPSASQLTYVSMLDLFRYSSASIANGTGVEDWTAGTTDKYFSVDGGTTKIASFATGLVHGDGAQASHWKDNQSLGIMDPTFGFGELGTVSMNDMRALDVIGYTRNNTWKWTDTSSASTSNWSNSAAWNTGAIPDNTITAFFNNNAASIYTMNLTAPATAAAVTVGKDNVTINIAGGSLSSGALTLGASSGDIANLKLQRTSGTGTFSVGTIAIGSVANSTGSLAVLSGTLSGSSDLAVGGTSSASAGVGSLTISGGNVSVAGNLKIWGTSGSSATLSSGSLTVAGNSTISANGKLLINGGAFSTSSLTDSGTYSQTGGTATLGAVSVNSGASFTAKQIQATSMTISGAATIAPTAGIASRIGSLTIPSGGKLDINNNSLVIPYTGTSPAAQIRQMIANTYNGGLWNGTSGITSSYAMNDSSGKTGVGYAEASNLGVTSFNGQSISGNAVLMKYTLYGDDNLDGVVNQDDFSIFVDGMNGLGSGWIYGDFNYDGVINQQDFSIFVQNFQGNQATLSSLQQEVLGSLSLSATQKSAMLAVIPEPGTISLIGLCAMGLMSRRRPRGS